MIELYFKNITTSIASISLIATLLYIGYTLVSPNHLPWGKKVFYLGAIGLWLCIIVVLRDDYVATVQSNQGLFAVDSKTILIAYMLTIGIVLCFVLSAFIKEQNLQQYLYWLLTFLIIVKIMIIEGSRIFM